MSISIKICGINEPVGLQAAAHHGAQWIGFVFYPPSPRAINLATALELAAKTSKEIKKVGLFVNPTNDALKEVTSHRLLDIIQLHGQETPRRVAEIAALTGLQLMKAVSVASAEDFATIDDYAPLVTQFLFDAKPPPGASLPGGNATAFDWRILAGRTFPRPWILAGGLTPENVTEAIRISGATMVDVSSGVEDRPGVKSPAKIAAFCQNARNRA